MHKQHAAFAHDSRHLANELKPAATFAWPTRLMQLLPGPKDRSLSRVVEPFRIKQRTAVVIAKDGEFKVHYRIEAFTGIRSIADHIAQADDVCHRLRSNVFHHRFERCQIAMDVANDRSFDHRLKAVR